MVLVHLKANDALLTAVAAISLAETPFPTYLAIYFEFELSFDMYFIDNAFCLDFSKFIIIVSIFL